MGRERAAKAFAAYSERGLRPSEVVEIPKAAAVIAKLLAMKVGKAAGSRRAGHHRHPGHDSFRARIHSRPRLAVKGKTPVEALPNFGFATRPPPGHQLDSHSFYERSV